ncbi:uncharacterized protein PV06_11887 [Exophiala oligosperma]|uniref:Uncharacterized protein n=1 Tax=Exophiala oligosperma TaxID=215243 RepID=A0A0D2CXG5_9EURO|nr:uncharacterized protein PV06_11887 [Exophiala oligosperma]KIW35773.1 hypothetical protein PV06_11887 [Exophiala oligosperma]
MYKPGEASIIMALPDQFGTDMVNALMSFAANSNVLANELADSLGSLAAWCGVTYCSDSGICITHNDDISRIVMVFLHRDGERYATALKDEFIELNSELIRMYRPQLTLVVSAWNIRDCDVYTKCEEAWNEFVLFQRMVSGESYDTSVYVRKSA